MEARAIAKTLRISPIRARLIVDLIRGKSTSEAVNILINKNNKASRLTKKVLDSAISNAVNNEGADANRYRHRRAVQQYMFDSRSHIGHNNHRTSHIIIVVATK